MHSDDTPTPREPLPSNRRPGHVSLGSVFGVAIDVPVLLVPLFILLAWLFATGVLPEQVGPDAYGPFALWVMGLLGATLLFASVLAHELAHALAERATGRRPERVTIFFHSGATASQSPARDAQSELLVAGSGPMVTLALGVGCFLASRGLSDVRWIGPLLHVGAIVNGLLAVSYLIPALPLDGGRLLRALAWLVSGDLVTGTRVACWTSRGLAVLLGTVSALMLPRAGLLSFWLWGLFLAFVLWTQAGMAWKVTRLRERLRDRVAADVLQPAPSPISRVVSAADALVDAERGIAGTRPRTWLVEYQGELGGIVTSAMLRRVPDAERAATPVGQVARRLGTAELLTPTSSLETALDRMTAMHLPALPVMDGGDLVGIVRREAILGLVERVPRRPAAEE